MLPSKTCSDEPSKLIQRQLGCSSGRRRRNNWAAETDEAQRRLDRTVRRPPRRRWRRHRQQRGRRSLLAAARSDEHGRNLAVDDDASSSGETSNDVGIDDDIFADVDNNVVDGVGDARTQWNHGWAGQGPILQTLWYNLTSTSWLNSPNILFNNLNCCPQPMFPTLWKWITVKCCPWRS